MDENKTDALVVANSSPPVEIGMTELNAESKALLSKIIAESNPEKTKDLTQLFNVNQNKKTLVRVDKLSELMDAITDQALTRFTQRPGEISNQELLQSLKTVSELIEKGQKQAAAQEQPPLIQINQQNNEVHVEDGSATAGLKRDSRERVKNAVLSLLGQLQNVQNVPEMPPITDDEDAELINNSTEELSDDE